MKNLKNATSFLLVVGALNWGLVGLFQYNVIDYVFGQTWIDRALYLVIGFSAIYKIINWQKK